MPAPVPRVSIVIVTWNALPLLRRCLPSVVATDYPDLEIVLADNASTDGSAEWVAATFPGVRIVRHPENWAFCRGNNAAIPHATGDYVLLLNNDVEVPPGWLSPLVARMQAEPRLGALQPKLHRHDRRTHFEYAGGAGGFVDAYGYPFTRGRLFFTLEEDRGQYDDARYAFWATGAALLLRRAALDSLPRHGGEVGLLDERFVMHMEEIDLCWRLWRAGWRVGVEPSSLVWHIGGASLPQGDARKAYFNFRNSLLLLYKNLPPAAWRRVFAARLVLDTAAAARALAGGNPAEAAAIARAYRDAHHLSKHYADTRPAAGTPSPFPPYRGSIVADYFLRRRRHFSALPRDRFALPDVS